MIVFSKYKMIGRISRLLILFSFFSVLMDAQCPDRKTLENVIAASKEPADLLLYVDKMKSCPYRNDSTHVHLVKTLGGLYFMQGNYLNAIKFYRQSIDIVASNANRSSLI